MIIEKDRDVGLGHGVNTETRRDSALPYPAMALQLYPEASGGPWDGFGAKQRVIKRH